MMLDENKPEIRKILKLGKSRGFITFEKLNKELPQGFSNPDTIDELIILLENQGVQVVEKAPDNASKSKSKPSLFGFLFDAAYEDRSL